MPRLCPPFVLYSSRVYNLTFLFHVLLFMGRGNRDTVKCAFYYGIDLKNRNRDEKETRKKREREVDM